MAGTQLSYPVTDFASTEMEIHAGGKLKPLDRLATKQRRNSCVSYFLHSFLT